MAARYCARHSEGILTVLCPHPDSTSLVCHQDGEAIGPGAATTIEFGRNIIRQVHFCSRACVLLWDAQHPDYWRSASDRTVLP